MYCRGFLHTVQLQLLLDQFISKDCYSLLFRMYCNMPLLSIMNFVNTTSQYHNDSIQCPPAFQLPKVNYCAKTKLNQYHATSGLMQILHFVWLHYQGTNSNSHRVAKFASLSFVFPQILPFLSDQLGATKIIRPFALKGHRSIALLASPHGLLTNSC